MQLVKRYRSVGAAERNAVALGCEDDVVEVFLSRCEGAGYRPGTSDIGDVATVFLCRRSADNMEELRKGLYSTSVHQDEFSVPGRD